MADLSASQWDNEYSNESFDLTEIVLLPHQHEHFERIKQISDKYRVHVDASATGTGKTYVTSKLSRETDLAIMLSAGPTMIPKWINVMDNHGVDSVEFLINGNLERGLSYRKLSGLAKTGVSHNLLIRDGNTFIPTDELYELIDEGILFVIDEVQNFKNIKTASTRAAIAICQAILFGDNPSRVALLSATAFDKDDHTVAMLQLMGILDRDLSVYNVGSNSHDNSGYEMVETFSARLDEHTTNIIGSFDRDGRGTAKRCRMAAYELYRDVITKHLLSSMEGMGNANVLNGFYRLPARDTRELQETVHGLSVAVNYDESTGRTKMSTGSIADVQRAIKAIERSKVPTIHRLAVEAMTDNPNCKVIIFLYGVTAQENIRKLFERSGHNPILMNGKTPISSRPSLMKRFQRPDTDYRVFVTSPKVGGVSVDLDDQHGDFPRTVFVVPDYGFISLYQAIGRVDRADTKSVATVRIVYSIDVPLERPIMEALDNKSKIVKEISGRVNDVMFDIKDYYEY